MTLEAAALQLSRDLQVSLAVTDVAAPGPGQVRVRVAWAGVCGSDLHVLRTGAWVPDDGWPATLGHEVCGVVDAVEDPDHDAASGSEFEPGDRVVLDPRVPCGQCQAGFTDDSTCATEPDGCQNLAWLGEAMPGGFAQYVTVPESMVHGIPDQLPLDLAVLAEPVAAALHAIAGVDDPMDPRGLGDVLIVGAGPIGQLAALLLDLPRNAPVAAAAGDADSVTVVDPHAGRRRLAAGLTAARVADRIDGTYDTVIDAAGYRGSLRDAVAATRQHGTVGLVAIPHDDVAISPADIAERGLRVTGSNGFRAELARAIEVLTDHGDRFRPLITDAVLLDEAAEALTGWLTEPALGKAVIRP